MQFSLFLLFVIANGLPVNKDYNKQDIQCININAVFEGTFQNPVDDRQSFNAQFQLQFNNNYDVGALSFKFWNHSLYSLDAVTPEMGTSQRWEAFYLSSQPALIPTNPSSKFILFGFRNNYPAYWFRLFLLNTTDGTWLSLPKTYNGCTNNLPTSGLDANLLPDPTQFRSCICCGEYNPDPDLNCPSSPLKSHTTCPSKG
ncbi:hypothetical protein M3Y97_00941400 [Aphelenchoides bicaudatus]|nr:hypothetical protein M3Y97_00941400 [Aphelenchoides bicaudatus]